MGQNSIESTRPDIHLWLWRARQQLLPGKLRIVLSGSHVAWRAGRQIPRNPSPLLAGELLFVISDNGICTCFDAITGKTHWQQRIGGNYSASPVLANGHVFVLSHEGKITAIPASRERKELKTSQATDELKASPAIVNSSVIVRSGSKLYRVN